MKRLILLPLLLFSAAALAGTPIDQTRDVAADGHVKIVNVKGAIRVSTWDRNQVHVTGTLGTGSPGLEIEKDGDALVIKVKTPNKSGLFHWNGDDNMEPSTLDVQVPRGASVAVDAVSATTDIRGLSGGTVDVNSVSGDVRIDADSPKVSVDAVSARVELSGAMQQADIQTVSGDIIAPKVAQRGDLETVSGEIHLHGGPFDRISMNTVSGDVDVDGSLQKNGRIEVDSVSGDVKLRLPGSLSAHMRVSTFSGDIHSAFGQVVEKAHGPGSSLDSRIGQGDGSIDVQTFSGDVKVEKND
ncbi:DUF4097 family beta strand repeat-containing protein [Oleiagrimonas soli]|uniref:DUF4097 domain-containing protein n=1 Tax=Oleiagrimonas soli TaxID=1543381 RepID=A0A099CY26_9GAMM|nr:DUF4097 family beta strand repeat-containing protein [Oleiagrimonas soli]KGI78531.1 hypothetical protein LF63_0103430 [Oleiagrimonas soli]MBB6184200.1 hypothetical protein [Oleiagrimonas soli]